MVLELPGVLEAHGVTPVFAAVLWNALVVTLGGFADQVVLVNCFVHCCVKELAGGRTARDPVHPSRTRRIERIRPRGFFRVAQFCFGLPGFCLRSKPCFFLWVRRLVDADLKRLVPCPSPTWHGPERNVVLNVAVGGHVLPEPFVTSEPRNHFPCFLLFRLLLLSESPNFQSVRYSPDSFVDELDGRRLQFSLSKVHTLSQIQHFDMTKPVPVVRRDI
mmetsp:Transcript_4252/g.6675  ORF Transcript_4252/g.6675 Transcript_4252/m.6675 type:complete len:218 (-) Transcript_4252:8377-9030(-)